MTEKTSVNASVAVLLGRLFRMSPLHRSTWCVGTLIAATLLLANIPGRIVRPIDNGRADSYDSIDDLGYFIDHGWPWTFLRRTFDDAMRRRIEKGYVDLDYVDAHPEGRERLAFVKANVFWGLTNHVKTVSAVCIVGDICTAVAILTASVAMFEVWRPRRRRLFQFYIGEVLAFVTLGAVLLSWLTVEIRERAEEQAAVRQMHAIVHHESLAGPHWLRYLVGSWPFSVFDRVEAIYIMTRFSSSVSVSEMGRRGSFSNPEQLLHFRHLRAIDCGGESPRMVLGLLARPDRLEELISLAFPCEGLSYLQQVPNLQKLKLFAGSAVTTSHDFDAVGLASLHRLRALDLGILWGTFLPASVTIDDECLSYVQNMSCLEVLAVYGPRVTDGGVNYLTSLCSLRRVNLNDTSLTDAGLQHLSKLLQLEKLIINRAKVTDAGLERLHHCKHLKELEVYGTEATRGGIKKLKEALPYCVVNRWGGE